jgi:hypothetical protein
VAPLERCMSVRVPVLTALVVGTLSGCSNVPTHHFATVSGTRHATGVPATYDTGSGGGDTGATTGGTTSSDDGSPVIRNVETSFAGDTGAPELQLTITYTDAQNDLDGGTVYFDFTDYSVSTVASQEQRSIVGADHYTDANAQAEITAAGEITFTIEHVTTDGHYTIGNLQIKDTAGHVSNGVTRNIGS